MLKLKNVWRNFKLCQQILLVEIVGNYFRRTFALNFFLPLLNTALNFINKFKKKTYSNILGSFSKIYGKLGTSSRTFTGTEKKTSLILNNIKQPYLDEFGHESSISGKL